MSMHAGELVDEVMEARRNPVMAFYESALSRRAVARLVRQHGDRLVREVLVGLSKKEDFEMARHLWNANHTDVPLYCFFRMRTEPLFRIESIRVAPWKVQAVVEWGGGGKKAEHREEFELHRDRYGRLVPPKFSAAKTVSRP